MCPANKKVRFMRAFLLAFGGKLMRTHEGVSLNRGLQAGGRTPVARDEQANKVGGAKAQPIVCPCHSR